MPRLSNNKQHVYNKNMLDYFYGGAKRNPTMIDPNNNLPEEFPGNQPNPSGRQNKYVDLLNNGRIFPSWVLKNFKQYKLNPILRLENEDPCNVQNKLELRKYQEFIGQYLAPNSLYSSILLYHGLGSGKTATAINLLNILYNYDHNINVIILIKGFSS